MLRLTLAGPESMQWPTNITFDAGSLIAGVLGFTAAIGAVLATLCTERCRARRELASLRRALGVEVRLYTANALEAHLYCKSLLLNDIGPRPALLMGDRAKPPPSVIYENAVVKVGEFRDCAATLV